MDCLADLQSSELRRLHVRAPRLLFRPAAVLSTLPFGGETWWPLASHQCAEMNWGEYVPIGEQPGLVCLFQLAEFVY